MGSRSFDTHALRRSASLLKSYPVRRSMAVSGRKSKTSCPHSEPSWTENLSHVCSGLAQSSHQHANLPHLLLKQSLDVHVSRYVHDSQNVNGHRLGTDSGAAVLCPLEDDAPPSTRRRTSRASISGSPGSRLSSLLNKVSANRARPISPPVIASSTRARHAAVCGLAAVFVRAASHPGHQPV